MSAVNENALQDQIGELYVIGRTDLSVAFLNDLSNSETLRAELDAMTFIRMASVTDLSLAVNLSDNLVEVEADDTGTLKKFTRPSAIISGNWFEVGDIDALKVLLGINSLDVVGSPTSVNYGMNLTTRTIPELIVKIVTVPDANNKVNTVYLYNSGLSGELVFSFLDVVRAGDLPVSAFELTGNKGGFVLINSERLGA
ncbi:MAG: hypothetical protein PHN31_01905 [Candidatus Gracilibacteria bacterium]|nr:hypothetical protein [Candidatus Gracilibacteria bacterium]